MQTLEEKLDEHLAKIKQECMALYDNQKKLSIIPIKNRVRDETAKEIKNYISEQFDEMYNEKPFIDADDFQMKIISYIDKEILCLSDYVTQTELDEDKALSLENSQF